MAKKKAAKKNADPPSFETALAELEQIVADLEAGELGLEEALECYERGVQRLKQCQQQLTTAQRRIELLSGIDADGNPITQPFDDDAEDSLEAKAATRGRKRTGVDDRDRLF